MDKKFLEKNKDSLEKQKASLEEELAQFTKKSIHNKDNYNASFPDFGDKEDENSAEVAAFSDRLSLERKLESSLRDVNKALEKIKKGTYGVCKYCSQEMTQKRILARPASSSCVECKKKLTGR